MYCKDCEHYREGGRCWKNRSGITSALAEDKKCFTPKSTTTMEEETKMKVCKVCGRTLPLDEFPKNPKAKDGHLNTCKVCWSTMKKAEYARRKGAAPVEVPDEVIPDIKPVAESCEEKKEGKCPFDDKFLDGLAQKVTERMTDDELMLELSSRGWKGKLVKEATLGE